MREPSLSQLVTVLDDFLEESSFRELQASLRRLSTCPPGADEAFVWRPGDTPPMVSREIYQSTAPQSTDVFNALARQLHGYEFAALQIVDFSIRLQAAHVGSCLSTHYDGNDPLSGGFAFYVNEVWDPHWGGLLIAFDPVTNGMAVNFAITPRRNRLVLLRNPVRHMVTQILPVAGEHVRLACTGYFRLRAAPSR